MVDGAFIDYCEQVASDTLGHLFLAKVVDVKERTLDDFIKTLAMVMTLETFVNHTLEATHCEEQLLLEARLPMTTSNLPSGSSLAESGSSVQQDGTTVLPALPLHCNFLHVVAWDFIHYSLGVFDRNTDRLVSPLCSTLRVAVKSVFALTGRTEETGPRDVSIERERNTLSTAITVRRLHGLCW